MDFKWSKETEWNQIQLNFYKYVQTKESPITGDGKHGVLFHKQMILTYNQFRCKENIAYRQVTNLNKRSK